MQMRVVRCPRAQFEIVIANAQKWSLGREWVSDAAKKKKNEIDGRMNKTNIV